MRPSNSLDDLKNAFSVSSNDKLTIHTMCYFDDFGLTLKIKELGHEKLTFWVTNNLATLNLAIFG